MASCEQRPSVTLWGTTQVTTLATVLSTITRPDAPRITSSVTTTTCDGDGICGPVPQQTIIVDEADLSFVTVTKETVVTNIIPVQTRYHPCPGATTTSASPVVETQPQPESTLASTPTEASRTGRDDSLTLTSTVPAPTSKTDDGGSATTPRMSLTRNGDTTHSALSGETTASILTNPTQDDSSPAVPLTSDHNGLSTMLPESTQSSFPTSGFGPGLDGSIATASSTSTEIGSSEIAGIVIGSLAGLIFLGLFILRCRGRRDRKEGGLVHQETYWERRFQELEGGVEKPASSPGAGVNELTEEESTHQLHVSLPQENAI